MPRALARVLLPPVLGGVLGFAAFAMCVGVHTLDVRDVDWIFPGGVDPSFHYLGWHGFRASPWSVPPGVTTAFGHPVGTSVALTDSIPLLAIPFKLLSPVLPRPFQYLGLWLASCFVLQGLFGALLTALVTDRRPLQVLGASLFVLAPILSYRLGHAALCAHWLLLAALWLNRRAAARGLDRRGHQAWACLALAAAATHPYLTAMVLALAMTTFAGQVGSLRQLVSALALPAAALVVVVAGTWWATGYFVVNDASALQISGFGRLSMNLLAPLIPSAGAWTFGRIPLTTAHYDQHEGFSYLGLGVLALVLVALPLLRPWRARRASRPDVMLVLALTGLTLFALGSAVTLGTRTVVEYDPAWWGPLTTFRAHGRMSWPVVYALMFGAIAVVVSRLPARVALVVLSLAVGLQVLDQAGVYRSRREGYRLRFDNPLRSHFWRTLPGSYAHLVMYPSNMCVPPGQGMDYRPLALVAGNAGMTFNGGNAARYDAVAIGRYCAQLSDEIQRGVLSNDTLYVVQPESASLLLSAPTPMTCTLVDGLSVCAPTRPEADGTTTATAFDGELGPT